MYEMDYRLSRFFGFIFFCSVLVVWCVWCVCEVCLGGWEAGRMGGWEVEGRGERGGRG